MRLSFHPEAESELMAAVEYYETCRAGLGRDFALEVLAAIQRILDFPNAWPLIAPEARRCLVARFPFGVIYNPADDCVLVLAVMHLHRHPDNWQQRPSPPGA